MAQCFMNQGKHFFEQICPDPTIESFKKVINDKKDVLISVNNLSSKLCTFGYCGTIVLQELITKKLNSIRGSLKFTLNTAEIDKRLAYFQSKIFLERFMAKIPTREGINVTVLQSSYSLWFNTIFNVKYPAWREEQLSKVDNQRQCRIAMGITNSTPVIDLQNKGNVICYICGQIILPAEPGGQKTMECEHKLSIFPALCHWWLIKAGKDEYTTQESNLLKEEYAWSHRCCNQLKDNYEFIYYDKGTKTYQCNKPVIEHILKLIKTGTIYDCPSIKGRDKINIEVRTIEICKQFSEILKGVNENLKKMDDYDAYNLLLKYKALSALSNDDFMEALVGTGELVEQVLSRKQKRELAAAEEIKLIELQKVESKIRVDARDARAKARSGGGPDKSSIKIISKHIEKSNKKIINLIAELNMISPETEKYRKYMRTITYYEKNIRLHTNLRTAIKNENTHYTTYYTDELHDLDKKFAGVYEEDYEDEDDDDDEEEEEEEGDDDDDDEEEEEEEGDDDDDDEEEEEEGDDDDEEGEDDIPTEPTDLRSEERTSTVAAERTLEGEDDIPTEPTALEEAQMNIRYDDLLNTMTLYNVFSPTKDEFENTVDKTFLCTTHYRFHEDGSVSKTFTAIPTPGIIRSNRQEFMEECGAHESTKAAAKAAAKPRSRKGGKKKTRKNRSYKK